MADSNSIRHVLKSTPFKEQAIKESGLLIVRLSNNISDEVADVFREEMERAPPAMKSTILCLINEIIQLTMHTTKSFIVSFGRDILHYTSLVAFDN
jgi:hypothetical protein